MRLLQREAAADAGALPVAERLPRIRRELPRPVPGANRSGSKCSGVVAPDRRVAVQLGDQDQQVWPAADFVAAAERRVLVRRRR